MQSFNNRLASLEDAVSLCREFEEFSPKFGCHVALTGGTLYKDGLRKDIDIMFYRIRQVEEIDYYGLFNALTEKGVFITASFGWVTKAVYKDFSLDLFFPEDVDAPCDNEDYR